MTLVVSPKPSVGRTLVDYAGHAEGGHEVCVTRLMLGSAGYGVFKDLDLKLLGRLGRATLILTLVYDAFGRM